MLENKLSNDQRTQYEDQLVNAAGSAITTLVHLAQYGETERCRLDAAKTIIDRVMGKVPDKVQVDAMAPIREFLEGVIVTAELSSMEAQVRAEDKALQIREARERERLASGE
jgi:hypothetical protein